MAEALVIEPHETQRLKDQFRHCFKLAASNKINLKNAFDLQLIDYLQQLIIEDGQLNFKIASSALDVGAKIYSHRVDCLQFEAQKVASSIMMALDGNTDDTRVESFTENETDEVEVSKKKRPTRTKNIKTVIEDETLHDAKIEEIVLGDAFLDGLSQEFDMTCPAALVCCNALIQQEGLLIIDSSYSREGNGEILASRENLTLITKNVNCAEIARKYMDDSICTRMENFLFNDKATTISGIDSIQPLNNEKELSISRPVGGPSEFIPELYDDNGDDNFGDADSGACDAENDQLSRDENEVIPDLDKIAASKPTDYVYSNEHHRLLNTWAGPHAWKIIKIPQSTKKDGLLKNAKKRIKLEQKPIEFLEEYSPSLEKMTDKEIRHSADVIKRWKKPLRPQDHNLTEESVRKIIFKSILRPEDTYHCMKTPAEASILVDIDHDYSKSPGLADDSDDEFRADAINDTYNGNNTLTQQDDLEFAGENLIEQPYTVAQVNIPFAKIAKKMDVRKLKRIIWDVLLPEETQFSRLYEELPDRVGTKMATDLSQPIAFVTLLHLANEKNLKLLPNNDLSDFIIEQDMC